MTNDHVKCQTRSHLITEIRMFSSTRLQCKISLLGHIIRSEPNDPMRQVLFEKGTLIPRLEFCKRPGKPRQQWLSTTYADAYQTLNLPHPFDMDNPAHRQLVNELALKRMGVFSWFTTENRHRKAEAFLPALPICSTLLGFFIYGFFLYSNSSHVSTTLGLKNALRGIDSFFTLGMSSGFCAQPAGDCAWENTYTYTYTYTITHTVAYTVTHACMHACMHAYKHT